MPTKPLHDRRVNVELTEEEVQLRICQQLDEARRARYSTLGGLAVGVVALGFATWAGLVNEDTVMALIGFAVSLIGFGVASPKQMVEIIRSIRGRNNRT